MFGRVRKVGGKMQIIKRTPTEVHINLLGVVQLLWKKIWVIAFCAILLCACSYIGAKVLITPQYATYITLYVNNSAVADMNTSITTSDLTASAKLVDTYAAIISSDSVLSDVAEQMGGDLTPEELKDQLSVSAVNNTEVFQVQVTDTDPTRAAEIANLIADMIPDKFGEIVDGSSTKVIDYAKVPTTIDSPNYKRYAVIGAILGMLISAAMILVRELLDTRIKSTADLDGWDIPIIGVIPEFASAEKRAAHGYGYAQQRSRGKR